MVMDYERAIACWNNKSNTLTVDSKWSFAVLQKAIGCLGLSQNQIDQIKLVVPSHCRLSLEGRNIRPVSVYVADNGKLITKAVRLPKVINDGICRFTQESDIESLINDGQVHVLSNSRIGSDLEDKVCENRRHIRLANKSYMYNFKMLAESSLEVSNSFVVDSWADDNSSIDFGTGFFIGCEGKLKQCSTPKIGTPVFNKLSVEHKLWISAIHFNAQICNRAVYTGPKPAHAATEHTDIENLIQHKSHPKLSSDLCRHLRNYSAWSAPVDSKLRRYGSLGIRILYPYK